MKQKFFCFSTMRVTRGEISTSIKPNLIFIGLSNSSDGYLTFSRCLRISNIKEHRRIKELFRNKSIKFKMLKKNIWVDVVNCSGKQVCGWLVGQGEWPANIFLSFRILSDGKQRQINVTNCIQIWLSSIDFFDCRMRMRTSMYYHKYYQLAKNQEIQSLQQL